MQAQAGQNPDAFVMCAGLLSPGSNMLCFWCQEDAAALECCTQCNSVAHTPCLAEYFLKGRSCPVCRADLRPTRRLDASKCALEKAENSDSEEHVVIMRKIDVAIAMSHCCLHREKQLLLEPLMRMKVAAANDWLVLVGCLEHARASLALSEHTLAKRSLRPLLKLRGEKDEFLTLLFAEGLCIYAKASLLQGKHATAWKSLQQALRISFDHPHAKGSLFCGASALRTVADLQQASGKHAASAMSLRRVTQMLEDASQDRYTIACARVDESAAHIAAGSLDEAASLLRTALPDLRKRKGGFDRTSEAALLLGALIEPRKRLRARTHPESVELSHCSL